MVWQKMVCAEHYLIEGDTSRALLHEANEDITVRCNRIYSNLYTQVSRANVTSIDNSPITPKILT